MIKVEQLSVSIRTKVILKNINLEIKPGEVLAIIGPNGAGKSTLLKAITGDIQHSTGNIQYNGIALRHYRPLNLAKIRGVLSQHVRPSFSISVLETVVMGRFPFQQKESVNLSKKIARWALAQVRLSGFEHRQLPSLSGGEQQRVHFARILAQLHTPNDSNSKYMFLDEPTASQDIAQQHHILNLAKTLARKSRYGIFLVLHDINLAAQYADRIILLRKGQIRYQGQPNQVLTQQNIKEVFDIQSVISRHPVFDCPYITTFTAPGQPIVSPIKSTIV